MGYTVILVILLTLQVVSVTAHTATMDYDLPVGGVESFYPDPAGLLRPLCDLCGLSITICAHAFTPATRHDSFTAAMFLNHPEWPGHSAAYVRSPSPEPEPEPEPQPQPQPQPQPPTYHMNGQPLLGSDLQRLDHSATTIQPSTIECWREGIFNPGYCDPSPSSVQPPPGRAPPQANGYLCEHPGCTKTYTRRCDLRRHQKIHLGRNERPHKCSFCGDGHLYPKDRDRHERTHPELRAVQPKIYCGVDGCRNVAGFPRRDNWLRHMRKLHPDVVPVV